MTANPVAFDTPEPSNSQRRHTTAEHHWHTDHGFDPIETENQWAWGTEW